MFNVENMPYTVESDGEPRYLFEGEYCSLLDYDIRFINGVLKEHGISLSIPPLNYNLHTPSNGPINYSFLKLNELTPSGGAPKYKYVVYFNTFIGNYIKEWMNDTFGQIHYLKNGKIGKVRIIFWRDKVLTVIHLKNDNNGNLIINKIDNK